MVQNNDRRTFLRLAGAGTLGAGLVALSACTGSRGTGGNGSGGGGSGQTRVRVAWWGGDVRHAKYNEIYDLYTSEHEGVTIEREYADYGGYFERLPTQFAGGNAPDVLHVTERQVADYAQHGQLADLEALAEQGHLDLSHFSAESLDAGRFDGTLVMLLVGATIPATMYNRRLFEEAGIDLPTVDWDWDTFYEACEGFRDALEDNQAGTTYQAIAGPPFETMLVQNGKSMFAPDASAELNFEAADAEEWFRYWREMLDEGLCQSAESASENQGAPFEDTMFAQANAAMHVQNSNQLVTFQTALGEDNPLGLAPFPQIGAEPAAFVIGSFVCVNEASQVKEDGASIIDFFVNDPRANEIFGLELGTPGNSNWEETVAGNLSEVDQQVLDFANEVAPISVYATPRPPGSGQSDTIMTEVGLAVAFGDLTPAEAGARLVDDLAAAIGAD
ncbi:ABC transporter substrate-binding protein [Georgenia deserti]|uniref:ABC transporter substrate-binding protein n=1 Tax=Georgenia deserti TaxID=2093781 RepID=A0ABW4L4D2_9MICO